MIAAALTVAHHLPELECACLIRGGLLHPDPDVAVIAFGQLEYLPESEWAGAVRAALARPESAVIAAAFE